MCTASALECGGHAAAFPVRARVAATPPLEPPSRSGSKIWFTDPYPEISRGLAALEKAAAWPPHSKASELQRHSREVPVMAVNWTTDVDKALATAKEQKKPLLLDFSAAPM